VCEALVWEGCFWIWLRPDGFPIIPGPDSINYLTSDNFTTVKFKDYQLSKLESLPIELYWYITKWLDLNLFLELPETSQTIQAIILKPSNGTGDQHAQKWFGIDSEKGQPQRKSGFGGTLRYRNSRRKGLVQPDLDLNGIL